MVVGSILYDLRVRPIMSIKSKAIAISAVALLAAAGGVYAFMPADTKGSSDSGKTASAARPSVEPQATEALPTSSPQGIEKADVEGQKAGEAQQQAATDQPGSPAPKKLTKQQLTPPPATADEQLQKAAEQESNF
jgi:hypothetical protein